MWVFDYCWLRSKPNKKYTVETIYGWRFRASFATRNLCFPFYFSIDLIIQLLCCESLWARFCWLSRVFLRTAPTDWTCWIPRWPNTMRTTSGTTRLLPCNTQAVGLHHPDYLLLKYEQPNQLMTPLLSQVKSFKVPFQIPSTTPATAMCLPLSTAHLPLSTIRPHFWNQSCYFYQLSGLLVECQPWDWDIVGLIPKRVIPKTMKWYPLCPCLTFST